MMNLLRAPRAAPIHRDRRPSPARAKDIALARTTRAGSYLDSIAYRSLERRGSDLAGGIQHGDVGKIAGGLLRRAQPTSPRMAMQKAGPKWSHIPGLQRVPEVFAAVNDKIAGGIKAAGEWVQGAGRHGGPTGIGSAGQVRRPTSSGSRRRVGPAGQVVH